MPKVSVIIPVYNTEKYLAQCLDSVINQTMRELEIICVNDGSTDNSLRVLNAYAEKDSRIIVIDQSNTNAGAARNNGLKIAKGEYIHFLDSDDYIDETAYAEAYKRALCKDSDIVVFLFRDLYDDGSLVKKNFLEGFHENKNMSIVSHAKALIYTSVAPWNKIYKRSFLINRQITFDEIDVRNDRTFYFKSIISAEKITPLKRFLITHRKDIGTSASRGSQSKFFYSYFISIDNIWEASEALPLDTKKMILYVCVRDMLRFYKKSEGKDKLEIANQIHNFFIEKHDYFEEFDISDFNWCPDYQILCNFHSKDFCDFENIVPIVFAANSEFLPYLSTAIESIVDNANLVNQYNIYVLHTDDMLIYRQNRIESQIKSKNNIKLLFVNIKKFASNDRFYARNHVSEEAFYRLYIPSLLYMYDKVLYLDCDLVLLDDPYNLYKCDISDYILGGVINLGGNEINERIRVCLGLEPDNFINSGVLLINNNTFNSQDMFNKCIKEMNSGKKVVFLDQQILNICCAGHIKLLDPAYNVQWHRLWQTNSKIPLDIPPCVAEAYKEMLLDPKIIHYTSGRKPWDMPECYLAEYFWKYARKTPFYEEIIYRRYTQHRETSGSASMKKKYSRGLLFAKLWQCYNERGLKYTIKRSFERLFRGGK